MAKLTIKTENGKPVAHITHTFNVGEVLPPNGNKVAHDGQIIYTHAVTADTEAMERVYTDLLYRHAKYDAHEKFVEALEAYKQWVLLNAIGVQSYPLVSNKDGSINGLHEDIEVELAHPWKDVGDAPE